MERVLCQSQSRLYVYEPQVPLNLQIVPAVIDQWVIQLLHEFLLGFAKMCVQLLMGVVFSWSRDSCWYLQNVPAVY
jgi:hypothetical protein